MARPDPTLWGVFWWLFSRWGNVEAFHDLGHRGLPSTLDFLRSNVQGFLRDARGRTGIFKSTEARIREGVDFDALAKQMVEGHLDNARTYLDAATFIFAHSILDEGVIACHGLLEAVDPAAFLASGRKPGTTGLAMPRRVEIVLVMCEYDGGDTGFNDYDFSIADLERLDRLRADVVHGDKLGDPIGLTDADVEFLKKTGGFVWLLIARKYMGRMTPEQLGSLPGPTQSPVVGEGR